jgi:hypothetical protein
MGNWTGAGFDAANIGGSGVNADGGTNNGTANDGFTYIASGRGQTFTTGGAVNGYDVAAITVRMAGYTNNMATGTNRTVWNLGPENGPLIIQIGRVNGTAWTSLTRQLFTAGGLGNPGSGTSANGPGTYITFHLPFTTHLEPNTTYGFEISVGNGSDNEFEWLGINSDVYGSGTAYSRSGTSVTPLTGDRVFQIDMTTLTSPPAPFVHPGTLHTPVDLARMAAKVAANAQPWKTGYDVLAGSPYAQTSWNPAPVDYIVRGGTGQNYTRSQQDGQAIYELALRWQIRSNTAYADRAALIANAWADTLLGVTGTTDASLAAGICGYLFAIGGDLLSTYPGWAAADKQAFKDMMMRVFYPANFDFLWRHHDTFWREGGNTHYRLNWDTFNMASLAAIGVLCDNRAVYEQALDFFKFGPGNGRIERAAWYVHPNGMAQGEEAGRDQGHNLTGWNAMAYLCQIGWNQGDDLYTYDKSRVLRALEYNAKYNLGFDVPSVPHRNTDLDYTEGGVSSAGRGNFIPTYEQIYNHYVNVLGVAAPYSKQVADAMRPEPRPNPSIHPSQVDWFGLGTLTFTRDPIGTSAPPGGLRGNWSKNAMTLNWWGSAYATNYNVKRANVTGGPYTIIGTAGALDTFFTDAAVTNGGEYFYVVSALTPTGETADSAELRVKQELVTRYTFENTLEDVVGTRDGAARGGSTGLPGFAAGPGSTGGQAVSLDGVDDYVQLPVGSGNYQDITIGAWVYWNGGGSWQRVFDFGSEIEKYMFLTPRSGSGTLRFQLTSTRGNSGTVTLDGPAMSTATWSHVAVTLNGDTATLYVNGVPVDAEVADLVDPLFGQPFCYLGRSMWNADPYFNGRIDDFRIYNYALSGADVYNLWGQSANQPPKFSNDPLTKPAVIEGTAYTQTLAGNATDANGGTLTYSKVTGPAWLSVAANGALSGVPSNAHVGVNLFVVRVTDPLGATDDANLYITVHPAIPDPPTGLTAASADRAVVLSWNASSRATGYIIKRATASGGPYTTIASNVTSLVFTNTGLSVGEMFYYVLNAFNSTGQSGDSAEASAAAGVQISPTFVAAGAVWRYFDRTNDLGTAWRSNSFNDASWSSGAARLGYGNDGEMTKVASNRQWTTYFRRPFYVGDPAQVTALTARLSRDDAAVIYLNGAEVWRDANFASGTITNQTPALVALGGADETNWLAKSLNAADLIAGTNLLAAEVHNQSLTSSDLGFDFELGATVILAAPPRLSAMSAASVLTLSWPSDASYFTLYAAANLSSPVAWTRVTNAPALTNSMWIVRIPPDVGSARFFRLEAQ